MSSSKRNKQVRNIKIQGIIGIMFLVGAFIVLLLMVGTFRYGITQQSFLYGMGMIVLLFGVGYFLVPALKYYIEKHK